MNLEEKYLNDAAAELFPIESDARFMGPVPPAEQEVAPVEFSYELTPESPEAIARIQAGRGTPASVIGMQPSKYSADITGGAAIPKQFSAEEMNQLMADPSLRFNTVSEQMKDIFNREPPSELISLDRTMREELSYQMQQTLVDKFNIDNYKAGRLADTLFGGDRSGAPLGLGLIDVTPFTIPLAVQESGISAGQAKQSFERGDYGQAALNYGVGMLQAAEAVPAVKIASKMAKGAAEALGPTAANMMEAGMRKTGMIADIIEPGPLTKTEKSIVIGSAGRNQELRESATKAIQNIHSNYSESNGWIPIEINKVTFKKAKDGTKIAEVDAAKIPYNFHTPPEGVSKNAWQSTLSSKLINEVNDVVSRAQSGDQAALNIIAEASWYRAMRDQLRSEFGGIGDVFADVLGTTSAKTDVRQNFKNAVSILNKFSRGDYDNALAAYEKRVKAGQAVDPTTLTELYKDGKFDLIRSDSGALFNTNSPASMGALLDMFRAVKAGDSPKTPNFTGNLIGLTNEATIDVWAARLLRRMADLPRIPPPAEKGVAGKHLVGSTLYEPNVGGEFGFGQSVFKDAADQINKSGAIKNLDPQIGDLGPDDLQAVAWFIEKEKWTNNGWTTKAGEGGSLDYEMSLAGSSNQNEISDLRKGINAGFKPPAMRVGENPNLGPSAYPVRVEAARQVDIDNKIAMRKELESMKAPLERYQLGISGERPNKPMSNYGQAEIAAELDDVVRNDTNVITYNLANTYGSFKGQTERALNAEFVARQGFKPENLERRMIEQGKAYDQDAVFVSKVIKDSASPNARPGVEIYFKQKISPDQMAAVTAKLREYGVDGFTYVTDMRFNDRINVQAKAGGAETAGLNGLRFQYIPEFDDAFNDANRSAIMAEKQNLFRQVVRDIMKEGNVSDARVVHYDTKVYFRDDYDAYLTRTAGDGNQGERGIGSGGADVAQPNTSGEVGKDFSRAVSDRLRKKGAAEKPAEEVTKKKEVTNITPVIYTKNFRNWFGKSAIVESSGTPQKMYHATSADIEEFRPGNTIYVSPSPKFAESYGGTKSPNIMPLYVKAEKPFNYENASDIKKLADAYKKLHGEDLFSKKTISSASGEMNLSKLDSNPISQRIKSGDWTIIEDKKVQAAIKKAGFDAFYIEENGVKNLGVYSPTQLKSTFNKGEFNPKDPKLLAGALPLGVTPEKDQTKE